VFQAHLAQNAPFQANNAQTLPFVTGDEWYLDSGATHHVTNDLNNLSSFLPYDGIDKLHVGNGAGMIIGHIGSTLLRFSDYTISLKNILFVPSFSKNIVSLSQLLHDNELLIEFSSDFVKLRTASPYERFFEPNPLEVSILYIFPWSSSLKCFLASAYLWMFGMLNLGTLHQLLLKRF
jgi:hypothetical protein